MSLSRASTVNGFACSRAASASALCHWSLRSGRSRSSQLDSVVSFGTSLRYRARRAKPAHPVAPGRTGPRDGARKEARCEDLLRRRDFTALLGASMLAAALPGCTRRSNVAPAFPTAPTSYDEAVRAIHGLIARDAADAAILPAALPRLYVHGGPVAARRRALPRVHQLPAAVRRARAPLSRARLQRVRAAHPAPRAQRPPHARPRERHRRRARGLRHVGVRADASAGHNGQRARLVAGRNDGDVARADAAARSRRADRAVSDPVPAAAVRRPIRDAAARHASEHVLLVGFSYQGEVLAALRVPGLSRRMR